MRQITKNLLMVRPSNFSSNFETLSSNAFQCQVESNSSQDSIQITALEEFDHMVRKLKSVNIEILVFDDINSFKNPDAIFPNNWVTFHNDGTVVIYPMMSPKRRKERRIDIIKSLSSLGFTVGDIIDLSHLENECLYLEGTGSMILDRVSKKAYACISSRTTSEALSVFSNTMNYQIIQFRSTTEIPIYHTNVMMSLGEETALVCFDAIEEEEICSKLRMDLKDSGRIVINVSIDQMNNFLGNALEVRNKKDEKYLLMSETAKKSLTVEQERMIEDRLNLLSFPIPTIEKYGGGSVRCMLAEIFLEKKDQQDI